MCYELLLPPLLYQGSACPAVCGLLHLLGHKQRCQEYEYICLKQTVENVKIKTYRDRYDQRHKELKQFQHHKSRQHISEESHTERQRPDDDLQYCDRRHHRNGLGEMFYPMFHSVLADARKFDQAHAHNSQSCRHVQIFCRRFKAEQRRKRVCCSQIEKYRDQIRAVSSAFFPENPFKKVLRPTYSRFQYELDFAGIFYPEVSRQDNRQQNKNRHDDPCDHHGFGDTSHDRKSEHCLTVQFFHQCFCQISRIAPSFFHQYLLTEPEKVMILGIKKRAVPL